MKEKKKAALIYENDQGHLDHLAPYCSLYNIPLYLTSTLLYGAAQKQYTKLTVHLLTPNAICKKLLEGYDQLISTLPKQIIDPLFLLDEMLLQKKLETFWLPHGSSDKENMGALVKEENLLVYGEKMKSMLPKAARRKCSFIGNFRLKYFLENKGFYSTLLEELYPEIFNRENILYAPSWEAHDIDQWVEALVSKKDPKVNLYIKLHPNTYLSPTGSLLAEKYNNRDNVFFIEGFFPIYPLLEKMSCLYTDISSIGYDFLVFDKNIFFTTKNNDPLHRCGVEVEIENPYTQIKNTTHHKERVALYRQTYACKSALHI